MSSQALDFYNRRLARVNAPSEASRAESLRLVSEAATQLAKTLAALPPALRLAASSRIMARSSATPPASKSKAMKRMQPTGKLPMWRCCAAFR